MRKYLLTAFAITSLLAGCGKKEEATTVSNPETNSQKAAGEEAAAAPAEFGLLKGRWARTDGDYIIEIKEVAAEGKLDAAYYNPSPIHVSKAVAIKESSGTKIFIELQDTGYPGCTYSLNLDTATSQLHGQYFQAAQNQTYDVVFAKLQE